jgi:hypothetical protein
VAYRRRSRHGIAVCQEHTGEWKIQHTLLNHTTKLTATRSKWPVIVGIILGSILALSIVWCVLKCICGGIASCFSCCDCCSSRNHSNNHAYQQPPPAQYPMHNQYYGPQQPVYSSAPMYAPSPMYAPPPMSGGAGYRGAAPSSPYETQSPQYSNNNNNNNKSATFNEDALPAFPTTASERRVPYEDMEMGHLQNPQAAQQQGFLASHNSSNADYYHGQQKQQPATDAAPAHDYDTHRQFASQSLYSQQDAAAPPPAPNRVTSMRSTQYEPSLYPPSYHTQAPGGNNAAQFAAAGGTTSPPPPFAGHAIGRKPVQGTWRDV